MWRKVSNLVIGDIIYLQESRRYSVIGIRPNEDDVNQIDITLRPIMEWSTRTITVRLDDYVNIY